MTNWIKWIGRAAGTGVVWAVAWAPIAVLIGIGIVDPDNSMDEMWPAIGAYPGFMCGVLFWVALGIAERGRRLAELPVSRGALWGALVGLPVGALPFAIGESTSEVPLMVLAGAVIGSITVLSAVSGAVSVVVARAHRGRMSLRFGSGAQHH